MFTALKITSTLDWHRQPIQVYVPEVQEPRPLVVILHGWRGNYRKGRFAAECLKECARRGWYGVQPNFRGPNNRPEACASPPAMQDVFDAADWMAQRFQLEDQPCYLVGASGGGHMGLMLTVQAPERWSGVSVWASVTDLAQWHAECATSKRWAHYARDLEAVCGGPPGVSPDVDAQYTLRSPLTFMKNARGVPLDINHGINDGQKGSVPPYHSLRAFNLLALAYDMPDVALTGTLDRDALRKLAARETSLLDVVDAVRQHTVLIRRRAGSARFTLFDGGHVGDAAAAFAWFESLQENRTTNLTATPHGNAQPSSLPPSDSHPSR